MSPGGCCISYVSLSTPGTPGQGAEVGGVERGAEFKPDILSFQKTTNENIKVDKIKGLI
jgi:hypothetical protein